MDLDIHTCEIIVTHSASRDARVRLGDETGAKVIKMLKTGKMVKKPWKDGSIGIVRYEGKKGNADIVFTCRRGALVVISVNTGDKI